MTEREKEVAVEKEVQKQKRQLPVIQNLKS